MKRLNILKDPDYIPKLNKKIDYLKEKEKLIY